MFFFIPMGVEGLTLRRIPWVSIAFAALMLLGFAYTWLPEHNRGEVSERELRQVYGEWSSRPYLSLSEDFQQLLNDEAIARYQEQHQRALENPPDPPSILGQQARLDAEADALVAQVRDSPLRRLSLVPSRGALQPGVFTYMFVHQGWMHLLGNLLFFYIVALLLEDIWGRALFPAFYVAGGVFAGLAQYAMDPHSAGAVLGASGAVAACMGAFAIRFATAKIRMGFVIIHVSIIRWVWLLPAWLLGLLWFGSEVLSYALGGAASSGTAVMAHIGGFMFGVAAALAIRVSGLERKVIAPKLEAQDLAYVRPEALDRADQALARGQPAEARQELEALLREQPENDDGQVALAALDLDFGDKRAGMARVERMLHKHLAANAPQRVWPIVDELGPRLDASLLRPAVAMRTAAAMEQAEEGMRHLAEPLYVAAAAAGGIAGAKALLRAAEVRMSSLRSADVALEYLARARAIPGLPPELLERAQQLEARASDPRLQRSSGRKLPKAPVEELHPRGAAEAAPEPPPPAPQVASDPLEAWGAPGAGPGAARILACRLSRASREGLELEAETGRRGVLGFGELVALAVAAAGDTRRGTGPALFADFVLSWGEGERGPSVLRVPVAALNLQQLYPAFPEEEALGVFVENVLQRSGAAPLPTEAVRRGEYPRYADLAELNLSLYGAAAR